jgi:Holliday junction DNA helicase RuvA
MFYSFSGKIIAKDQNFVVIETAGIGFKLFVLNDLSSSLQIGKRIRLYSFFHSENFELYGFLKQSEKSFFEMLVGISGIGPKNALKIMNLIDIPSLKSAIASEDLRALKDAGISVKTASKIILELKGKLDKESALSPGRKVPVQELKDALRSLGYSKKDIDFVVSQIPESAKKVEDMVKMALKIIASRGH